MAKRPFARAIHNSEQSRQETVAKLGLPEDASWGDISTHRSNKGRGKPTGFGGGPA